MKRLNERNWPDTVRIVDFGIRGFDLSYALLDEYDLTILVDATPRGEEPGTLYAIEPELDELDRNVPEHSGKLVWKIIGGVALALVAAGIISSIHDIRRYIRIVRM